MQLYGGLLLLLYAQHDADAAPVLAAAAVAHEDFCYTQIAYV